MKEKDYKSKIWLHYKYWNRRESMGNIGEICGVSKNTIHYWMKKFNISRREGEFQEGHTINLGKRQTVEQRKESEKKNKERVKKYSRRWRKANPNYNKKYYIKNRTACLKRRKAWYEERQEQIKDAFENECYFCDAFKKLLIHRKDGQPHVWGASLDVLRNINDYTLLCCYCHTGIHWCMKHLGFTWDDVLKYKEIKNEKK